MRLFICFIFGLVGFLPSQVFCFDTNIAHPNIAELATKVYNEKFDVKLTNQEISWIRFGAADEDVPTRWVNHFYDPVHNKGLLGQFLSAPNWAQDSLAQADFSVGDNCWQRALDDYDKNNREYAFKELGHILHLVADMAVPAHTRNDMHPTGDSLESYVAANWNKIAKEIKPNFLSVSNLSAAFDGLSNYSNNNFYSDDTIEDRDFAKIEVAEKITDVGKGKLKRFFIDKKGANIYFDDNPLSWQDYSRGNLAAHFSLNDELILSGYAQVLVPKAIAYDAGVIKLFMDEAKKGIRQKNLSLFRITPAGMMNRLMGYVVEAAETEYNKSKASSGNGQSALVTNLVNPAAEMIQTASNNTIAVVVAIKGFVLGEKIIDSPVKLAEEIAIDSSTGVQQAALSTLPEQSPVAVETPASSYSVVAPDISASSAVQPQAKISPAVLITVNPGTGYNISSVQIQTPATSTDEVVSSTISDTSTFKDDATSTSTITSSTEEFSSATSTTSTVDVVTSTESVSSTTATTSTVEEEIINFGPTILDGVQSANTLTLTKNNSPYLLKMYTVPVGKTLNVEAGVVIKADAPVGKDGMWLNIYGTLKINGTSDSSVYLTSGRDNNVSKINGSKRTIGNWLVSSTPQVGDWRGIRFYPNSVGEINNLVMRYAGKSFQPQSNSHWLSQAVRVENGVNLTLENSTLEYNEGTTLLSDDVPTVLYLESAVSTIKNNRFAFGKRAVYSKDSALTISGNTFDNFTNQFGPTYISTNWPISENNTFTNNVLNGIYLSQISIGDTITAPANSSWYMDSATVEKSGILKIEPGATINMMPESDINVSGNLEAIGTAVSPINIVAAKSDDVTGNLWWNQIVFDNASGTLNYVNLKNGNRMSNWRRDTGGMVFLKNHSGVTINNSSILDARTPKDMIQTYDSILNMDSCVIGQSDTTAKDIVGIRGFDSVVNVSNNTYLNLLVSVMTSTRQ